MNVMLGGIKKGLITLQKITIVVIVLFAVINLFLYLTSDKKTASVNPLKTERQKLYESFNDPKLAEKKETKALSQIHQALLCKLLGENCNDNQGNADKNFKNSLLGKASGLITFPFTNPPASGVYWTYSGLQNAGIVPQAFAAEGVGFSAIRPLMNIWKVMRDVAYLILVVVIILIGFMVMFRMKLNPQTVISVESALPKIVLSLIYITFSFAIAGFLIDFMYVIIVLGISVLAKADPTLIESQLQNQYTAAQFGTIWDSMFPIKSWETGIPIFGGFIHLFQLGQGLAEILPSWINDGVRLLGLLFLGFPLLKDYMKLNDFVGLPSILNNLDVLGNSLGSLPRGIIFGIPLLAIGVGLALIVSLVYGAGWILGLLIFFTMLLLLFRIFFLLLMTYLKIILMIIFAPIFMLFEAVPGKGGFSYWFKNLLAEIIVFPAVILIMVTARVLINVTINSNYNVWQPPFLYGLNPKNFAIVLGMAIIFMVPELVKLIKEFMGVKGLPLGLNLGVFFGGAGTGTGGAMGILHQYSSIVYGANTAGLGKFLKFLPGFDESVKGIHPHPQKNTS
ncbi:MAG: hypothetical protein HYW86_01185 [Candidatus Roizmanbacteria bacterium]|nr:MAG: hypothetical protein HYW86_01185 [Candidatus Roizmanbacteria bacterium]